MATQVGGPYDYTATGVLGDKRNTMLRNELHLRNKVGHVKTRGFNLPGGGFVYGLPSGRRDFTAAYALRGWAGAFPETCANSKSRPVPDRDFMGLNRAAVACGLVKPAEIYDYRATYDIGQSPIKSQMAGRMCSRRLPPTMVFGVPSRPSTPIYDLIEHKYQAQWLSDRQRQLQAKRSADAKRRVMSAPVVSRGHNIIYETRSSVLRTYQNPVEPAPLWQLTRFSSSAKPHVQTFRTDAAKDVAFRNVETDKVARQDKFYVSSS